MMNVTNHAPSETNPNAPLHNHPNSTVHDPTAATESDTTPNRIEQNRTDPHSETIRRNLKKPEKT